MRPRQMLVDQRQHLIGSMRSGDAQNLRMLLDDALRIGAQAAGDDDLAVGIEGFAYGLQGLIDSRVDEAAGVDHNHVGRAVVWRDVVAAKAQLRENAFGVD